MQTFVFISIKTPFVTFLRYNRMIKEITSPKLNVTMKGKSTNCCSQTDLIVAKQFSADITAYTLIETVVSLIAGYSPTENNGGIVSSENLVGINSRSRM